jgi:hypothetical protein
VSINSTRFCTVRVFVYLCQLTVRIFVRYAFLFRINSPHLVFICMVRVFHGGGTHFCLELTVRVFVYSVCVCSCRLWILYWNGVDVELLSTMTRLLNAICKTWLDLTVQFVCETKPCKYTDILSRLLRIVFRSLHFAVRWTVMIGQCSRGSNWQTWYCGQINRAA